MIRLVTLCLLSLLVLGGWTSCQRFQRFLGIEPAASAPAQQGPGEVLASLGSSLVWAGGLAAAVGVAAIVLLASPWGRLIAFIPGVDGVGRVLLSLGLAIVALGSSFVYLADNLWLLWLAIGGTVVCWGWYHRRGLRRWMVRMGMADAVPRIKAIP